MRNILVAIPNDSLGGAEQYLKMVSEHFLNDPDNYVFILFIRKKETGDWEHLKKFNNSKIIYTEFVTERKGLCKFLLNLYKLRKVSFDYVFTSHVHLNSVIGFLRKVKILKSKFHVGRESTSIFIRFKGVKLKVFKFLYEIGYSSVDLLICQTDFMRNQLVTNLPWIEKRIIVKTLPNPIDFNRLNSIDGAEENMVPFQNFIVSAGRLIDEKGFDILIESFASLKIVCPDINLVILGEGLKRGMLEEKISLLKLEESVFLPGFVKNVYPYFKKAKLCVVSSRIEGFPNVLLQMMSQNRKVVSTKCAGGIENMPGIFISETGDKSSLYRAMDLALNSDTETNDVLFSEYLKERSIDKFLSKVDSYLNI